MKRLMIIALALVLTLGMLAGCRSSQEDTGNTTGNSAATENQRPDNGGILPDAGDMMPNSTVAPTAGNDGTVDPTNGANQDAGTDNQSGATDSTTGNEGRNRNRRHPMQ